VAEITQTYQKGKKLVFSPESTKKMSTPRMLTRAQTRQMPKDNTVEQVQGELEQSPRHADDSPLQHFEEEMPHEQEMFDHGDKSNEEIIKEKQAQIQELKDDLAKENHMVALLKQENRLLKLNAMHQNTSPGHPSSNKAKDKGKTLIGLEEVLRLRKQGVLAWESKPILGEAIEEGQQRHQAAEKHGETLFHQEPDLQN
jgi:hypothetical protein